MSTPNETTEMWREHNKDKQERHAGWNKRNRQQIKDSGISFIDKGETLLFRNPDAPKADFYPSTGRWRQVGKGTPDGVWSGGAKDFLDWYQYKCICMQNEKRPY